MQAKPILDDRVDNPMELSFNQKLSYSSQMEEIANPIGMLLVNMHCSADKQSEELPFL
jgi:hypothetical protein